MALPIGESIIIAATLKFLSLIAPGDCYQSDECMVQMRLSLGVAMLGFVIMTLAQRKNPQAEPLLNPTNGPRP